MSDDQLQTLRLTDSEVAAEIQRTKLLQQAHQLALVIYVPDGVRNIPLVEGDHMVIGRSPLADISIPDGSLSRQHASVEMVNQEVWLEDLGSTNGTQVNGVPVERVCLALGMEVTLGAIPASLQLMSGTEQEMLRLDNHHAFQEALAAEVCRARTFGRTVALVMARDRREQPEHVGRWVPPLAGLLRGFDHCGLYGASTAEFLLAEPDTQLLDRLTAALQEHGPAELRCSVALYPGAASSADELLEAARAALQQATAEEPVVWATSGAGLDEREASGKRMVPPRCESMIKLYDTARRVARSSLPLLVYGETGVGKEILARMLHEESKRADQPLVSVNCGAVVQELVISTLFGHEKGAFTGASKATKGLFESADGGTLFLDEVAELDAAAQVALLRALETGRITRVGSSQEIAVDVRIIAATHRDLESRCNEGVFRWDLYYRLNTVILKVPPLRERVAEIGELVHQFIRRAYDAEETRITTIQPEALELLKQYRWPGNIRELRNVVERAVVISLSDVLSVADLPDYICGVGRTSQVYLQAMTAPADQETKPEAGAENGDPGEPAEPVPSDLKAEMQRHEAELILRALSAANWDRKEAAAQLGLPVRTLAHKMSQHGIKRRAYDKS